MSQQCSWPTHSWPLEGRCPYYALLGLTQAPGLAGGPDCCPTFHKQDHFSLQRREEESSVTKINTGNGASVKSL